MQIKTTVGCNLQPARMAYHLENVQRVNAGEDVERRESACTIDGNVNWYSHYREQYRDSLRN